MKGILALAFILVSSQSMAAEWRYITSSSDGDMMYMDFSSITSPTTSKKRAWTLLVSKDNETTKQFNVYDCPNRETASISSVKYNQNGGVIDSFTFPKPEYSPIVPDSIGETAFLAACDLKQRARMKAASRRTFDPKLDAQLRRNPPGAADNTNLEASEDTSETKVDEAPIIEPQPESPFDYCKGRCASGWHWAKQYKVFSLTVCDDLGRGAEFALGCYYWVRHPYP